MAYIPGVPDVSVAPPGTSSVGDIHVNSSGHGSQHVSKGSRGSTSIGSRAHSAGKGARTEHVPSPVHSRGAGSSHITGGNASLHSMGHYGKKAPKQLADVVGVAGATDPTSHAGTNMIRGGKGQMRSHIFFGGLGPGKRSQVGRPGMLPMASEDNE